MRCGFDNRKALQMLLRKQEASSSRTDVAQAVALTQKYIWPNGSTIKIYFELTPEGAKDYSWGQEMWWEQATRKSRDPLQDELYHLPISFPEVVHRIVKERIAPLVHLKFEFTDDPLDADILIVLVPEVAMWAHNMFGTTAFALLSKDILELREKKSLLQRGGLSEEQTLALKDELTTPNMVFVKEKIKVSTIIHEFLHTLGMVHEHQNPMDGAGIFNLENLTCAFGEDLYKQCKILNDNNMYNSTAYDPDSIMLYDFPGQAFCEDKWVDITRDGKPIVAGKKLSDGDIRWLKENYPGGGFEVNELPDKFRARPLYHWSMKYMFVLVLYLTCFYFLSLRPRQNSRMFTVAAIGLLYIPFELDRDGKILLLAVLFLIAFLWGRSRSSEPSVPSEPSFQTH